MSAFLIWASLLLLLGLSLVVLEVFVPSGGILGCLAGLSLVVSIILAFLSGPWTGLGFMTVVIIALPICIGVALRVWPETPMGRRILLDVPRGDEMLPNDQHRRGLKELVGKVGRAKSLMLPSGVVAIGDQVVDAVSEGLAIEAGQLVRVVEVHGNRVVVRPTDEEAVGSINTDEALNRPIDTIGLDPFQDPIA